MGMFDIDETDILEGTILDPGWYPVTVRTCEEKASQKDGSAYWAMTGVVANGSGKGVPLRWAFSEKFKSPAITFLRALGVDVKPGQVDLEGSVGKTLSIYIDNELYNGRMQNKAGDYRVLAA
jgi:hypothetical protein